MEKIYKREKTRGVMVDKTRLYGLPLTQGLPKPAGVKFDTLRKISTNVHVIRLCINTLKELVSQTKWIIKPKDEDKGAKQEHIDILTELFEHPNKTQDTFRTFLDKLLEDLLSLDAGCVEKVRGRDGSISELFVVDGASIRPVYDQYGNQDVELEVRALDPKQPADKKEKVSFIQYMPQPIGQESNTTYYAYGTQGYVTAWWEKKDFIYLMKHPQNAIQRFGFGLSAIEGILMVVQNILDIDNYNSTYFGAGVFPPSVINIKGNITEEEMQRIREHFYEEAEWHRPLIVQGAEGVDFVNIKSNNNREMEFSQYMEFMLRLAAAAFGLSALDLNITGDVNRATSEVLRDLTNSKGYRSTLNLLREAFNQEIIWKDFGFTDVEFEWETEQLLENVQAQADMITRLVASGVWSRNEGRVKSGQDPRPEPIFDDLMVDTPAGPMRVGEQPLQPESEEPEGNARDEDTQDDREGEETEEEVGGEGRYNKAQKSYIIRKSVEVSDGDKTYVCYVDDRGYAQPFICYDAVTHEGYVIKPPIAVNLYAPDTLEPELTQKMRDAGCNVPDVRLMSRADVEREILTSPAVLTEFQEYMAMGPRYDSSKWRQKHGGSREFDHYLVYPFLNGRNLCDKLLVEDMKRAPEEYSQAVDDIAKLWLNEKKLQVGDMRADHVLVTDDKRAWGIDYQFSNSSSHPWEDTKDSYARALKEIPELYERFQEAIKEPDEEEPAPDAT